MALFTALFNDKGSEEATEYIWRMHILEAVEKNDSKLLQESLQAVTMVTAENGQSLNNALISAASKGYQDCVELLLKFGAECDQADPYSNTPLILAAERGHTPVVKMLLQEGCHVNRTDTETRTALHWASMNGHKEIVRLLLQFGALSDQKDKIYGFTPIMLASRQGHVGVLRLLLEQPCNVTKTDIHGETALFDAVRNNQLKCVELLLQVDADINHCDKSDRTPLLTAVLWNRKEAAIRLIQANCHLEIPGKIAYVAPSDMRKCTPIEAAVLERNYKMSLILAAAGARLSALYKHACFPEMLQAFGMSKEMVTWLTQVIRQPRNLRELCRMQIREIIGTRFSFAVHVSELPLPKTLQCYLTIPELKDFLAPDPEEFPKYDPR